MNVYSLIETLGYYQSGKKANFTLIKRYTLLSAFQRTHSHNLNHAERRVLTLSTFKTFVDGGFVQAAEA